MFIQSSRIAVLFFLLSLETIIGSEEGFKVLFSTGMHFPIQDWTGREMLISKIHKNRESIIFVRTSNTEFVVKDEKSSEIYLKLSTEVSSFSPRFDVAILVDFRKTDDEITLLFYGSSGFYCARSTAKPVSLLPGEHWLPIKYLDVHKWHLFEVIKLSDPYPESPGAETGIREARINNKGNIEFVVDGPEGKEPLVDEFAFEGRKYKDQQDFWYSISKNGQKCESPQVWYRGYKPFIVDEMVELEMNKRSPSKTRNEWKFNGKDEATKWYRSKFNDKKAAEEIILTLEKVYSADSKEK